MKNAHFAKCFINGQFYYYNRKKNRYVPTTYLEISGPPWEDGSENGENDENYAENAENGENYAENDENYAENGENDAENDENEAENDENYTENDENGPQNGLNSSEHAQLSASRGFGTPNDPQFT
jgi:hypothetical protein